MRAPAERLPRTAEIMSPSVQTGTSAGKSVSAIVLARRGGSSKRRDFESGVDFEKRILAIYQECRTSEEIEAAFQKLREEMDESIRARMDDTKRKLFERFD